MGSEHTRMAILNYLNTGKCKFFLIVIIVCSVLFARRPDQFYSPYMWVEDGSILLPQYISKGWLSIFEPVAGYILIPNKIILALSTKLSFLHQPTISYWLMVIFTVGVIATIAFSPTGLKWPFVCAISVLFIPTDAEVFAVSGYAFWWGTLLAIVPLLWVETAEHQGLPSRIAMLTIGGLSSPMIIGLTALYAMRLYLVRTRNDAILFATATAFAITQIVSLVYTGDLSHSTGVKFDPIGILAKFFGFFIYLPESADGYLLSVIIGGALLLFILGSFYYVRRRLTFCELALSGCLALGIATSIVRVSVEIIHPILAGPRYFFFAYIALSWLLIQLAALGCLKQRMVVIIIFAFALRQTSSYGQRFHDEIDWQSEIIACTQSTNYHLPIHYDGMRERAWSVPLRGEDCRRLVNESIFGQLPARP